MKRVNENTKVTLTVGQLKKLVKESRCAFRLESGTTLFHLRDMLNQIIDKDRSMGNNKVVVVGKGEKIPLNIETINYGAEGEVQLIVNPILSWGGLDY